jgi:hypothetical protein
MLYDVIIIFVINNEYNLRIVVEHYFYVITSYFILRYYSFINLIRLVDNVLREGYTLSIFWMGIRLGSLLVITKGNLGASYGFLASLIHPSLISSLAFFGVVY